MADPDFGIAANHFLEANRLPRRRMEQSLPLISGGPLRSGNIVFAPGLRAVGATAGFHQTFDERLLLVHGNGLHGMAPKGSSYRGNPPERVRPPPWDNQKYACSVPCAVAGFRSPGATHHRGPADEPRRRGVSKRPVRGGGATF